MPDFCQIMVPQLGEGVHQVKIVRILKQTGEWVDEDGDLIEIETDKATYEVPAPVAGYVTNIFCSDGQQLDVGDLMMEIEGKSAGAKNIQQKRKAEQLTRNANPIQTRRELPQRQLNLIQRMQESQNIVIPASIEKSLNWEKIENIRKACRRDSSAIVPSALELIAYAVSQSMFKYEKFRAKLSPSNYFEINDDCHIGLAVSVDEDELITPAIHVRSTHNLQDVSALSRQTVNKAKTGENASSEYHSLTISSMSALGVVSARPIVVYPAVATLFIGAPFHSAGRNNATEKFANFVLAFDHRVINGAYAAKFLNGIDEKLEEIARNKGVNVNDRA